MGEGVKGAVAISAAGRDKGRRFMVICAADDAHVLISDGRTHRVERPKRKKLKHLRFTGERIEGAETLIDNSDGAADARIRGALARPAGDREKDRVNKEG